MDKAQLQTIFSKAYNHNEWLEVLKQVFGARQLLLQPKPISLVSNDITEAAFELGNITTSDDRIIGLYKIDVKSNVWLERNKVGLRKLLRDVYKYDVDGALIVFVQENKWRLSFVSEVKVINDEGEIVKEVTEPKRYTYLLGEGEKIQTPAIFLSKLINKVYSLEDVRKSFSVDILNEEFYKIIQQKFYELVGGKIGSTKKQTDFGNGQLILPGITKEAKQIHQEFGVRLIGRTVFCWFLKMKKEKNGEPLISEILLSTKAVKNNQNYYHSILERLFFQTLNTPMNERLDNLPAGCEKVPFLNGGLFEPGTDDYYRFNKLTGLSEHINTLQISDYWFLSFFEELEKYNFTIDENSVTDVEVSVDPEMLGRIFENLLAEIDPDSGETARKATGSFYTPREIVDYMAIESLVQYLHNKTTIKQDRLRDIFKMSEYKEFEFSDTETKNILKALDTVKILDPACGSGAFPMGVLQKIVVALQKLDKNAEWWIQQRINENKNTTARKAVKEKLEGNSQYARKIGIIQNSLYGVDIQPIAAEISKLRCFLTLVVDERIDDSKPNRGIDPLPNLEFKFVTADTLLKLPEQNGQRGMFDHFEELEELEQLRTDYLQSSGSEKQKIKDRFPIVQKKIFKEQMNLFIDTESRAYKLSTWNPFGHNKADWFDSKWMYGVEEFDIVIGNPPYVSYYSNTGSSLSPEQKKFFVNNYYTVKKVNDRINAMNLFSERGLSLLKNEGILSFIVNKTFAVLPSYKFVREELLKRAKLNYIATNLDPFKAIVDCMVFGMTKTVNNKNYYTQVYDGQLVYFTNVPVETFLENQNIELNVPKYNQLIKTIESESEKLGDLMTVNRGVNIGGNFDNFLSKNQLSEDYKKFIASVRSLNKYTYNWSEQLDCFFKFDSKLELKLRNEGSTMVLGNQERYLQPKLFIPESTQNLQASFVINEVYSAYGIMVGTQLDKNYGLKFLSCLLNSKLMTFYALEKEILRKGTKATPHIGVKGINYLPVKKVNPKIQKIFEILVDYILVINELSLNINEHVSNNHISLLIEDVIDAMVMEIYFKEDFEKTGIEFIKYAARDFESIKEKSESERIEIIHRAYQKLREKDNEIRNNLKLVDIKLADIVMPIKATR